MGVIIEDIKDDTLNISVNWWNWRPTIELIRKFKIIDDERLEMMGYNATGVIIKKNEARIIGKKIEEDILKNMNTGERISINLELIKELDDYKFHREDLDKNYSAEYDWLKKFSIFCLKCEGFEVL